MALCLALREAGKVLARVPLLETCAAALTVQSYGPGELRTGCCPEADRGGLVLIAAANDRTATTRPTSP